MKPLRAARFVLIWFALSVGVAIASPWVKPQSLLLVCSGASSKLLAASSDDGSTPDRGSSLDCPACLFFGAPNPVAPIAAFVAVESTERVAPAVELAPVVLASAAPLPARGPPLLT